MQLVTTLSILFFLIKDPSRAFQQIAQISSVSLSDSLSVSAAAGMHRRKTKQRTKNRRTKNRKKKAPPAAAAACMADNVVGFFCSSSNFLSLFSVLPGKISECLTFNRVSLIDQGEVREAIVIFPSRRFGGQFGQGLRRVASQSTHPPHRDL